MVPRLELQILRHEMTFAMLTLPLTGRFIPAQSSSSEASQLYVLSVDFPNNVPKGKLGSSIL